jgi:DNA-binding IclR family transcriptional regulator
MPVGSLQSLRLAFKRSFTAYFLELHSPGIADPTEAFEAARAYLSALMQQLGEAEFMHRLDDETTTLAGQVEQDLRHRFAGRQSQPAFDELEDRLRECFEYGLSQLYRPE